MKETVEEKQRSGEEDIFLIQNKCTNLYSNCMPALYFKLYAEIKELKWHVNTALGVLSHPWKE